MRRPSRSGTPAKEAPARLCFARAHRAPQRPNPGKDSQKNFLNCASKVTTYTLKRQSVSSCGWGDSMVAIFTGKGTGLERGSAFVLGSQGQLGSSLQGRGGDGVFVNVSSGNLVITRQDEFLIGLGPDAAISRTYNSQATVSDGDNNDQWQMSVYRRVTGLSGTYGASGTTVKRIDWDGSETLYTWSADFYSTGNGAYVAEDGAGAYDTLTYSSSQWTWQDGDSRIKDVYNSSGQLLSTSDLDGNVLTYRYDGSRIDRVTTQNGEYTDLTYDGTKLTKLVTYNGSTLTRVFYTYDATTNQLIKVQVNLDPSDNNAGGSYETNYTYETGTNRISSITQTDGSSLQIEYDTSGRVKKLTQLIAGTTNRITELDYAPANAPSGTRTSVKDNAGNYTLLDYDAAGQLLAITLPPAAAGQPVQVTRFGYDSHGNVVTVTDPAGKTVRNTYDTARGTLLSSQDAAGNRIERTYGTDNNQLLTETRFLEPDPDGTGSEPADGALVTHYVYSETDPTRSVKENHLRFVINALGEVTEYVYDAGATGSGAPGKLTSTILYTSDAYDGSTWTETALASWASGLSDRSTLQRTDTTYTARGSVDTVTRWGTTTSGGAGTGTDKSIDTFVYDQAGQLLSRNNSASGATEYFVYDGLGRVTSSTDLAGNATTIVFDDANTTTTLTLANSSTRASVYNKAGELLSYTASGSDFETAVTTYKYDNLGRLRMVVTKLTSTTSSTVHMLYDNAGRKVADIGPDGAVTEYRYDASNNVTSTTRYANKLTGTQLGSLVTGGGEPANVTLDSLRPSLTDVAANEWTFNIYDPANRLVQTIDATGATTVFKYDGTSQLVSTRSYATAISSTNIAALKARETNPNQWTNTDGTTWTKINLTAATSGMIDGNTAYKFTVINGGAYETTVGYGGLTMNAGDIVSWTISVKAVGTVTSNSFGILGWSDSWGSNEGSIATIESGQGSLVQLGGGLWRVDNLSTSETTRITITRRSAVTQTVEAYAIVGDTNFPAIHAGDAMILANPVFTQRATKPVYEPSTSGSDRVTRTFYDDAGRVVASHNGTGGLTRIFYDRAGRKVREIGYAKAVSGTTLTDLDNNVVTSSADRRVDYVYDGRGFLRFTVDANGHPTEYVHDARGNVTRTIDYAGSIASSSSYSLSYVQAQLSSTGLASNSANRISRTTYDAAGRTAFTIDATGAVVGFSYDDGNRVTRQIAYATLFTTAGDQSLTAMQGWHTSHASDSGNRLTRNLYDKAGQLAHIVDAETYVTSFSRDAAGRVTRERRYDGTFTVTDSTTKANLDTTLAAVTAGAWTDTTYSYNAAGLVLDKTDGIGTVTRFTYDALGQVTDVTVAYGTSDASTTHRVYDAAGRVVSETDAHGVSGVATTVTYEYDAVGNMLSRQDGQSNAMGSTYKVTYTYDAMGRVLTETVPVNAASSDDLVTTNEYDGFGSLVKTSDRRGFSAYSYYNNLGQLILQIDQQGYATQTAYTAFGQVQWVTRYATATTGATTAAAPPITSASDDATTYFYYDKCGRVIQVMDAEGSSEYYHLTTFGERYETINKAGGTTLQYYDRLGRNYDEIVYADAYRPDGTLQASGYFRFYQTYDSRGNILWRYDAFGLEEQRITGYTYDRANRLTYVSHEAVTVTASDMSGTSSASPIETYVYNRRGQLIQSVDAAGGKSTTWYDALGRKTHAVNAVGTLTTWTYDANGNALTMRVYDSAVSIPGTPPSATPPSGTGTYREIGYAYDRANRQLSTSVASLITGQYSGTTWSSNSSDTITTSIDRLKWGGVIKETDGRDNVTWTWLDGLGRKVAQVDRENYLTVWELDTNGNTKTEIRYATKITGSFDEASSVTALKGLAGTSTDDRKTTFTYDRNGHRLTESRWNVKASTVSGTGGLTETSTTATIAYTYNALGLVATRTEANGVDVTTYAYDTSGRLTSVTGPAYLDQTGTSVQRRTENFYDAFDRIVRTEVNRVGGSSADDRVTTFTYVKDRLSETSDAMGFTRYYGYDIAGRVVQEKWTRTKSDTTLTQVTEATNYRYNAAGQVITQANATWSGSAWVYGEATRIRYNAHGEVTGKGITGSPASTAVYQESFEYDAAGRLWRTNSGDGAYKVMFYDRGGNVTLTLSSLGATLSTQSYATLAGTLDTAGVSSLGTSGGISSAIAVSTISIFDKRGLQTASREPDRQLGHNGSSFTTANLVNGRTYNAFGEVTSETDARGYASGANPADYTTNFSYNTMGRLVKKEAPSVSFTSESGTTSTARPTEDYFYDISGRLVGVRDANANQAGTTSAITTRHLLAGTGLANGEEALVTAEFHLDGGVARTFYDAFGDMRIQRNELYVSGSTTDFDEKYTYDKMGRVTRVQHRGNLLTDHYVNDELGRRIRHYNSKLTSAVVERTDYDLMGRVSKQVDMAGGVTTIGYSWSDTLATTGLAEGSAAFGGWVKTTTNMASLSATESQDYFGRTVARTDYGSHSYSYSFDAGGRLVSQTGASGQSQSYSWLNSGRLYQIVDTAGSGKNVITARYGYDVAGNRIYEGYAGTVYSFKYPSSTTSATETLQNATIAYDALNRITTFTDKDAGGTTRITVTTSYDLGGNIRRVESVYPDLAAGSGTKSSDKWFRYDSMNRMTVADGTLSGGTIVRGLFGYDVTYDKAGRRATQTKDAGLTGHSWIFIWNAGHGPGSPEPLEVPADGVNGHYSYVKASFTGERREEYGYRADGALATVSFAETAYTDNENGSVTAIAGTFRDAELRAEYQRDEMGRIIRYREFEQPVPGETPGSTVTHDRYAIEYDLRNNVTHEVVSQSKRVGSYGYEVHVTETDNHYSTDGRLTLTETDNSVGGGPITPTTMAYTYDWYDGARIATTTYDKDASSGSSNTSWVSTYYYDGLGRVASVKIADDRPRTVSFAYAPEGQVLNRRERSGATVNPEDQRYFVNGRQIGEITSDGSNDPSLLDYATNLNSIRDLTPNRQLAPFRWNNTTGATYATFGPGAGYDVVNPYGQGAQSTSSTYQVRDGETLQSIASAAWGDASLWYLIAEANGLGAGSQLVAGQSLILPDRVTNAHNSSDAFRVYDPNSALGDLSPTSAKPPKKPGACAVIGQILMVAIAIGVTILTSGAAVAAMGGASGVFSGVAALATGTVGGVVGGTAIGATTLMAAGAVGGAIGSVASQAFGVATGLQDKFSWKGVAMSAISGAIGAGVGQVGAINRISSPFAQGALRGALGSALSQGVGVATGLQEKFSWANVATAALGSGIAAEMSHGLDRTISAGGFRAELAKGLINVVSGTANAGLRSLVTGTSFGDNIIAALPDILGTVVGNLVANSGRPSPGPVQTASNNHQLPEWGRAAPISDTPVQNILVIANPAASGLRTSSNWLNNYWATSWTRVTDAGWWPRESTGFVDTMFRIHGAIQQSVFRPYQPHIRQAATPVARINTFDQLQNNIANALGSGLDIRRITTEAVLATRDPVVINSYRQHLENEARVLQLIDDHFFGPANAVNDLFSAIGNIPLGTRSLNGGPVYQTKTGRDRLPDVQTEPIYLREMFFPVEAMTAFRGVLGGVSRSGSGTVSNSGGTANAATGPRLANQLIEENLAAIASQDTRLAAALNDTGNFSIGTGTAAEADRLGRIWVGDGARPMGRLPGGLVSADGTRTYRPPEPKNSPYAITGVQANFQRSSNGAVVSNGHLNIIP